MLSILLSFSFRLQNKVNVESLPDSILLEIFAYLDPQSLCRCSQVSVCVRVCVFVCVCLCVIIIYL